MTTSDDKKLVEFFNSSIAEKITNTGRRSIIRLQIAARVAELKATPGRLSMSDLDIMLRDALEDGRFIELAALATFLAEVTEE